MTSFRIARPIRPRPLMATLVVNVRSTGRVSRSFVGLLGLPFLHGHLAISRMCSRSLVVFALCLQPVCDAITWLLAALDVELVCPPADLLVRRRAVCLVVPRRHVTVSRGSTCPMSYAG